jgi:hypothetical protein
LHAMRNRWTEGSWNNWLSQFLPLARWFGIQSPNPSMAELQELRKIVPAKVFTETVPEVLKRARMSEDKLAQKLAFMWNKLELGNPISLRSFYETEDECDPSEFEGVALIMPGTMAWTGRRVERTELVQLAGAKFRRKLVFYSSRICEAPPDWRHPYIKATSSKGREPTEEKLLRQWLFNKPDYEFVELPETPPGEPLSAEGQLKYFIESGQFDRLVGDEKVFMAINPNATYRVLETKRELGLDDIWFSQGASRLVQPLPKHWWPEDQEALTTPAGTIRFWIELRRAGLINDDAPTK